MRTAFDRNDVPPVQRRAPKGTSSRSRTSKKRPLSSHDLSSDDDEGLTEAFTGGRVKQRQDKRCLAADIALQNNLNPQRPLILDQTTAERFRISESSPESTIASEPRAKQEQHHPQLIDARYTPEEAGRIRYSPLARVQRQSSSETFTAVGNLVNASAAPEEVARLAPLASHAMFAAKCSSYGASPSRQCDKASHTDHSLYPNNQQAPRAKSALTGPGRPQYRIRHPDHHDQQPTHISIRYQHSNFDIHYGRFRHLVHLPIPHAHAQTTPVGHHNPDKPHSTTVADCARIMGAWQWAGRDMSEHAAYRKWVADNRVELRDDLDELMAEEEAGS
jgi:hypothetical protein